MSQKRIAIVASKSSLDEAYPPFLLASTAAALGYDCRMFFTFYGLHLLRPQLDLKLSPLGNPALRSRLPILFRTIPGAESLATRALQRRMAARGVEPIQSLRSLCMDAGVRMVACRMTMDLLGLSTGDLMPEVEQGGAATFFDFAGESDICLFV